MRGTHITRISTLGLAASLTACSPSSSSEGASGSTGTDVDPTAEAESSGGSDSGEDAGSGGGTSGPASGTASSDTSTGSSDADTGMETSGSVVPKNPNDGPIYAIGDSVMEFYDDEGASIPQVAAGVAGFEVVNASRGGAMVLEGEEPIPAQYEPGDWSWVIVEGGANDLGDGCGCGECLFVVDALIGEDSDEGAMFDLLELIRTDGNFILIAGYYRIPTNAEEFVECKEEFEALNARYQAYADQHETVLFVDMGTVMDGTDASLYAEDRVHPSIEGSAAVGTMIGEVLSGE